MIQDGCQLETAPVSKSPIVQRRRMLYHGHLESEAIVVVGFSVCILAWRFPKSELSAKKLLMAPANHRGHGGMELH